MLHYRFLKNYWLSRVGLLVDLLKAEEGGCQKTKIISGLEKERKLYKRRRGMSDYLCMKREVCQKKKRERGNRKK